MPILYDEPSDKYHASGHHGVHALMDFHDRGPLFFQKRHVTKEWLREERSNAFDIGTAAHALILEGAGAYASRVAIRPDTYANDKGEMKPWTMAANVCKTWVAAQEGRLILSDGEDLMVQGMANAVRDHKQANDLLYTAKPEVTCRIKLDGVPLQCRYDKLHTKHIVDLKTCDSITGFRRDIFKYHYDRQAAHYQHVLFEETGEFLPFHFVVVEKSAPHRVGVYVLDAPVLARAHSLNLALIEKVRECYQKNAWPDGSVPTIQTVFLPEWMDRE